jgi:hypothetical protein
MSFKLHQELINPPLFDAEDIMNKKKKEQLLSALSPRAQMAFAAVCGERAKMEGANFSKQVTAQAKLLDKGLDLAWKYAEGTDFDYMKDVFPTHRKLAQAAPDLDQPGADEVFLYVISGVARPLLILERPEKSAAAAVSASGCIINLVGLVYENPEKIEDEEKKWQATALELLRNWGSKPLRRGMFSGIKEPSRGKVRALFAR